MLTTDELVEYALGEISTDNLWKSHPDNHPQQMAYDSLADVTGYGGAAGGGKTDLLLGLAFTQHRRARIFRRLFTDLEDIVARGDQIQEGRCSFVWGVKRRWDTPDGRRIMLGAVQHDKDLLKYKGRAADFIGFDEADEFPEHYFRFLTGWLRTTDPQQRTRIVMTFNPPGTPEGEWIIQYFAPWLDESHTNPAEPGELRWFVRIDNHDVEVPDNQPFEHEGETLYPKSRTFIRALVEDNPYLMHNENYMGQLSSLPEPLKSQLRYGDFTISTSDDIWQVIPTTWLLQAEARWQVRDKPPLSLGAMGVDPARGGQDDFCIAKLYGNWFDEPLVYSGIPTDSGAKGATLVLNAIDEGADPRIGIDIIGIGSAVYDFLSAGHDDVIGINAGAAATARTRDGKFRFKNLRSQMWWQFREALDPESGENIALPPDRRLRQELRTPTFKRVGDMIQVESKETIRQRLKRSTDVGDAFIQAWYTISSANSLGIWF